jgi:hypothetical protein
LTLAVEAGRTASQASPSVPTMTSTQQQDSPPLELLRLRAEVTRLRSQQRELAGASNENAQLRARLVERGPKALPPALPPDYLLRTKAQWVGLDTPEHTLQSFLWAAQNRDLTNFARTLGPADAERLQAQWSTTGASKEDIFKEMDAFPGFRIVDRKQREDGALVLQVELVPGMDTESIELRQIGGEWKMQW